MYNSTGLSFADSGRSDGTWHYQVRACSRIGCSGFRSTSLLVEHPPSIPTGITSPAESSSKTFTVSWNAVSPVNTYELQWRTGTNAFSTIKTGLTLTSAGVTVTYNGTHDFRVRACRTLSCSGYSGITSTFVFSGGWGGSSTTSSLDGSTGSDNTCGTSEAPTAEEIANQPPPTVVEGGATAEPATGC